jgi:hypothetical protein
MKWLIRRVLKRGKGAIQYEEEIHFGEILTIGRATNQAIFLPDMRAALEHARVIATGRGKFRVESLIYAGVRINDQIEQSATVGSGATIEIGTTRITIVDPPKDYEAAVEVGPIDKEEQKSRAEAARLPTTLAEAGLSKRRISWVLFGIFAVLGLLLPMTAHFQPALGEMLKGSNTLGLGVWEAGEIGAPHHFFGQDCGECHGTPFEVVQDDKCIECHKATLAHADQTKFPMFELAEARCAWCHRDHNGVDGLIRTDQPLCSDCHQNLSERTHGASALADVGDFSKQHPQFMVNLPAWDDDGAYAPRRVSMDSTPLVENSGLKFPHNTHLDPEGLNSPDGRRVLDCASCHVPDAGGAIMQPVNFEAMCQDCHRLDFDRQFPDRQVPHGNVPEVLYMLDEFYSKRALEGGYDDVTAPATVRTRRRPGQTMTRQEQDEALAWSRQKARQVTESLFLGRACTVCHTVTVEPEAETGPWVIAPVRVAGVWFEKASFTHAKHLTMECADCHAAGPTEQDPTGGSGSSADVLIPDISNCQSCHAGEHPEGNFLSSTCIACHGFHQYDQPLRKAGEL